MAKFIDLIGKRFGILVIIKRIGIDRWGQSRWLCRCDCGNETIVVGSSLKRGLTQSCGCLNKEKVIKRSTKHGHCKRGQVTGFYQSWCDMIQRCTNPNHKMYKYYGGRGITVCDEWLHSFTNFERDNPGWKPGLTIERKDKNGNYCPGNCEWVTMKQQNRNKRNSICIPYNGKNRLL